MASALPFTVLLAVVSLVSANPVTPIEPTITPPPLVRREEYESLVGWYWDYDSSSYVESFNDEMSYTIRDESIIDWCPTTWSDWASSCSVSMWTSCSGSTLYSAGGSEVCTSTCDYDIIYPSNTPVSEALTWYHCMSTRSWLYFYMEEPSAEADAFSSDFFSSSSSSSSDITTTPTATSTASPGSTSPSVASQTSQPSQTPSATPVPEKKESKAWIAGAVVGSTAVIAIAGLAFYLIRRRRENPAQPQYQIAPQMQGYSPNMPQQGGGYLSPQQGGYPEGYISPPPNAMSPNLAPYPGPQGFYGQETKPLDTNSVGGHSPSLQPQTVSMYSATPQQGHVSMQQMPHMAASPQELPELTSVQR